MTVNFTKTEDDPRVVYKEYIILLETSCKVTEPINIIDPVVLVKYDRTIYDCNTFTIPNFSRWYFLTDITVINGEMMVVSGHVDVLRSNITEIRANGGIIGRQQHLANHYLNDPEYVLSQKTQTVNKLFPKSPFTNQTSNFVLKLVGGD